MLAAVALFFVLLAKNARDAQQLNQSGTIQTFNLKVKPLGSDTYSTQQAKVSLTLPTGAVVSFKDEIGLTVKLNDSYFILQTTPSDSGTMYDQKPQVTTLSTDSIGTLYRIAISEGATSQYLKDRFGAEGTAVSFYTDNYSETNCGSSFDPITGTTAAVPACGNYSITIGSYMILSAYCVSSNITTDCDNLVRSMKTEVVKAE